MEHDFRRKKGADQGYLISMPEGYLLSLADDACARDNYPIRSELEIAPRDLDPWRLHITNSRDQLYDNYHNFRVP